MLMYAMTDAHYLPYLAAILRKELLETCNNGKLSQSLFTPTLLQNNYAGTQAIVFICLSPDLPF